MPTAPQTKAKRIAFLAAAACVLQVVESFFPHPLPGLRLGLANVIALLALFDLGFTAAVQISILRTLVASLMIGTFLSPTFLLSSAGAIVSVSLLGLLHRLTIARGRVVLSIIGFSILGAVVHNLTQLVMIYFFLGQNNGTFVLTPWLVLTGAGTGLFTGIIAAKALHLVQSAEAPGTETAALPRAAAARTEQAPQPATVKLVLAITFIIAIILAPRPDIVLPAALAVLLALYAVAKLPFTTAWGALKRVAFLIVFTFTISAVFAEGELTARLAAGAFFSGKIVLILLCTTLVTATTQAADLAAGMAKLLAPLRLFGVSPDGLSTVIVDSIESVPRFWQVFRDYRHNQRCTGRKIREIIPWLASLLAHFYQEAAFAEQNGSD